MYRSVCLLASLLFAVAAVRADTATDSSSWKGYVEAKTLKESPIDPYLFYVALPFNDLAHPDLAHQWIPKTWLHPSERNLSACKDHWLQLRSQSGRTCYAQWMGSIPGASDDATYVFGDASPKGHYGMYVSPCVAISLDLDNTPSPVSWRFVDADQVPPGSWLKHAEHVLILAAIKDSDAETQAQNIGTTVGFDREAINRAMFLKAFQAMDNGERALARGQKREAQVDYTEALTTLQLLGGRDPQWQAAVVNDRMKDAKSKLDDIAIFESIANHE